MVFLTERPAHGGPAVGPSAASPAQPHLNSPIRSFSFFFSPAVMVVRVRSFALPLPCARGSQGVRRERCSPAFAASPCHHQASGWEQQLQRLKGLGSCTQAHTPATPCSSCVSRKATLLHLARGAETPTGSRTPFLPSCAPPGGYMPSHAQHRTTPRLACATPPSPPRLHAHAMRSPAPGP